jgi:hypothetical protein
MKAARAPLPLVPVARTFPCPGCRRALPISRQQDRDFTVCVCCKLDRIGQVLTRRETTPPTAGPPGGAPMTNDLPESLCASLQRAVHVTIIVIVTPHLPACSDVPVERLLDAITDAAVDGAIAAMDSIVTSTAPAVA